MDDRSWIARFGFWALALLWLPAGVAAQAAVRFLPETGAAEPGTWSATVRMAGASLAVLVPCGLPLALGCRRLWRLRYRRAAWAVGIGLGAITIAASPVAGLLGPVAITVYAIVLSLPVLGRLVVAGAARLSPEGGGPAAQQTMAEYDWMLAEVGRCYWGVQEGV